jgi:hypothetical protein
MPLYVVRWPNLSAALVRAEDPRELIDILDEISDPDGCTWAEYDGPLFLDFELAATVRVDADGSDPARPLAPEQLRIENVDALVSRVQAPVTITPCAETGDAMIEAICRFAFPATAAIYWGDTDEIDHNDLERALQEDAMRMVEYTWRRSHLYRSSDPDAQLAIIMRTSPEWIKLQRAAALEGNEGEEWDEGEELESKSPNDITEMLDIARATWLESRDASTVRQILLDTMQLLDEVSADGPKV